ncbi:MAG: hypothetical protein HQ582_15490 [Planctomycetes bacterium]|nr:hypothetical protein [Planctomycetota bacterium]
MNDDTELQEMFRRLAQAVPADPSLIDSVMRRIEQSPSIPTPGRTRNWIMRHPVFRVAAAAIVVLAIVGVALLFHGGGTTPAFADFIEPILKAKTVKYKLTTETKGPPPVTTTGEMMVLDTTRMRWETQMPDKSKRVTIEDMSQGKQLILMVGSKTATIHTSAPTDRTSADGDFLAGLRSLLLNARQKPDVKREPLGEKDIDGRRVIGFKIALPGAIMDLWGDPKTGLPVCFEITGGMDGSMKATASDFVFNAEMDESLFSVEPPAGYTVQHMKFDASPREEKDVIAMFREYSRLTGTLPDSLDMKTVRNNLAAWGRAPNKWERLGLGGMGNVTEEQEHRHQTMLRGDELNVSELSQLMHEIVWQNIAPENVGANEEQRFKELRLKRSEGKVNDEQFEEAIREIGGDQMLKAYVAWRKEAAGRNAAAERIAAASQTPQGVAKEEARMRKFKEAQQRIKRGVEFARRLWPANDAHFVGKGVSPGEADKPIFWYRPDNSKKYRVIYADFSAREADAAPNVPNAQPVPTPFAPTQ